MLAKLSELMFVEVVRSYIDSLPEELPRLARRPARPQVGAALRLIHGRPADDWTLDRLAREVGLSRSVFADRFTHYVGTSPMHYLGRWRMQLAAARLEHPGVSIAQAGAEVGYESEAAFNRAFKKSSACPPALAPPRQDRRRRGLRRRRQGPDALKTERRPVCRTPQQEADHFADVAAQALGVSPR